MYRMLHVYTLPARSGNCKMAIEKNPWLVFIMSQPGKSTTPRIRLWRLLKGLGAAVLRDGVYLLPQRETLRQALEEQVQGVQTLGGAAYVLAVEPVTATDAHFRALFDRSEEYAALLTTISQWRATLAETTEAPARRVLQQVRREYEAIVSHSRCWLPALTWGQIWPWPGWACSCMRWTWGGCPCPRPPDSKRFSPECGPPARTMTRCSRP